jgi:hypothetical protein
LLAAVWWARTSGGGLFTFQPKAAVVAAVVHVLRYVLVAAGPVFLFSGGRTVWNRGLRVLVVVWVASFLMTIATRLVGGVVMVWCAHRVDGAGQAPHPRVVPLCVQDMKADDPFWFLLDMRPSVAKAVPEAPPVGRQP